jgi:hypothetical protein
MGEPINVGTGKNYDPRKGAVCVRANLIVPMITHLVVVIAEKMLFIRMGGASLNLSQEDCG